MIRSIHIKNNFINEKITQIKYIFSNVIAITNIFKRLFIKTIKLK